MPKKLYILSVFSLLFLSISCNYTRHVPEGQSILWDNDIILNGKDKASSEAYNILKQRPTPHYGIFAPNLAIYNWGNGSDSSFFSKIGDPPIIFDPQKAERGAQQLRNHFFKKGYFNVKSRYEAESSHNGKWVHVDYFIELGPQYFISKYEVDISNAEMLRLYKYYRKDILVEPGQTYDDYLLGKERDRLAEIFKDNGFYNFSKNYISFKADTSVAGDSVSVKMIISQQPVIHVDSISYQNHERYRIANVYIRPDYSYFNPTTPNDTSTFLNYNIIYDTLRYKPRYLTDAIHFKKGELYRKNRVKESYSHLTSYGAFEITEISFANAGRDSTGPILNSYINLSPVKKRTILVETEATSSSGNYGINLKLGWTSRNVFKAGEELNLKINSGIDFQTGLQDQGTSQTYELGGELNLKFPRFVLPFNTVRLLPKRMRPTSKISIYANRVLRFEFDRENFGSRLSYNWLENSRKLHQVDLIDISYSRLFDINPTFESNLNEIQRSAFSNALISASRYTYTYNQQKNTDKKNHSFLRTTLETAGNILSLVESNTSLGTEDINGTNQIANVTYYQYLKLEADYRYYWNISKNLSWVNRAYAATIRPYGNSIVSDTSGKVSRNPPFAKYLFIGGSNDLRAWPAYRLGAGTQLNTFYEGQGNNDSNFALGTIKLLINSELRFPLFSFFKGAIFLDAGNIWLNGGLEDEETDFVLKDILNQFALGTGFGLRMDFNYFLIRLDIAAKLRDPGRLSIGDPWVIDNRPFSNLTFNIALGYPF